MFGQDNMTGPYAVNATCCLETSSAIGPDSHIKATPACFLLSTRLRGHTFVIFLGVGRCMISSGCYNNKFTQYLL